MPFTPDMTLHKRPDCDRCGLKEEAIMLIGNQFFCGRCVAKYVRAKQMMEQKMVFSAMEEMEDEPN